MKIRKKVAGFLAAVMLCSYTNVFADIQERLPLDGLDTPIVDHNVSEGEENISPKVSISFSKVNNEHLNSNKEHETAFYDIILRDSLGNKPLEGRITGISEDRPLVELSASNMEDITALRNGTLYQLKVQPGHYHVPEDNRDAKDWPKAPLNPTTKDPVKYFVTDLNTLAREKNGELEVVWEYIPGATYELVYIAKAATTKAEVDGTDNNEAGVGSNKVTLKANQMNVFTENGIKKVKYVLEDTIPGQRYSAYVLVTNINDGFLTDSWSQVGVNKTNPKVVSATKTIELKVNNIGNQRIELSWDVRSWMTGKISMIKVWRKMEGELSYSLIGTVYKDSDISSTDSGRFEHDEPNRKSFYYVEFFIEGEKESIRTNDAEYVPYELREQPLKPQIPKPFSDSINKDELSTTKNNYLVKNDDITVDKMKEHTFHIKSTNPLQIQLVWDAQMTNGPGGNKVPDYNLVYDIWVTDDESALSDDSEPIIKDLSIANNMDEYLIKTQATQEVVGFKCILDKYITGNGVKKNLLTNKSYYIKLVAKREYGNEYIKSEPTTVIITIDKDGDISSPPVLAKPPLRLQENGVTMTSLTLEWLEKWYEVRANDASKYINDEDEYFLAKLWNSTVYTGGSPSIKFKAGSGLVKHQLISEEKLKQVKSLVKDFDTSYESRGVSLGTDIKYEVKTLLYDDVINNIKGNGNGEAGSIKIEKWIVENESTSEEGWSTITPTKVDYPDQLDWKAYTVEGLKPNTRYVILIRAYRVLDDGTKLMQTYPSFVIGTTLSEHEDPEAIPTVPVLNPNGVTDSSVSVWWKYNEDFDYEIVYSRLEDPNSAISWPITFSSNIGDSNYVSNGAKATATITGLMPKTTYNVWIKAKQKKGDKASDWSNPVTQTTSDIETPNVPRGLAPAAYQTILEAGKDFKPVAADYITVEWLKDVNDVSTEIANNRTYSYVLEVANNPEFLDSLLIDTSESGEGDYEILTKVLIRINKLEANRPYYFRVKTVLTFTDPESDRKIIKESEFCEAIRIMTSTSSSEYDGGDNENIVIYPEAIIETYKNGVWTYEMVDTAKIISQMIDRRSYFLKITMTNKYNADVRRIKMDKSIVDTLINKGMALKVITNVAEYEITGKSLNYYAKQYGAKDKVQIDLTNQTAYSVSAFGRSYPEMFVKGERLQVTFAGKNKNTSVEKFDEAIKIKLIMDLVGQYNFDSLYPYNYSYNSSTWSKPVTSIENQVDKSYFTIKTAYPGLFAIYEKQQITSTNQSTYLMNELKNEYNIVGLGDRYFQNDYVYANEYIQLLLGIAQNKQSIDLMSNVTAETRSKAKMSGIYISSSTGTITEEQAIAGIVKLYELKQHYQVKPSNRSVANVSQNYKVAVGKAYAIGLIDHINPKNKVTYAQLCDWIMQVIS